MQNSQQKLRFHIQIFINSEIGIGSTLFRKPSVGNSLHTTSSHPASLMIASVPYGQYLRLKRNCSENAHFEQNAKALQTRLKQRGYSSKCL